MSEHDVLKIEADYVKIEDQKLALYLKWVSINPNATWRDVITTLTSLNENTLAQDIKDHIESDALSITSLSPQTSNVTQPASTGKYHFIYIHTIILVICKI